MSHAPATAMTCPRTRRSRTGLLLAGALVLAASFAATAATPRTFQGQPVHDMPIPLPDGQTVVLHATDAGFIPESSERLEFVQAGHMFSRGAGDRPPAYRWSFGLVVKGAARPTRVVLEELTPQGWAPQVDDTEPVVGGGSLPMWSGEGDGCEIDRKQPCSAWLYRDKVEVFVFRATVAFDDGTTEVLHQGSSFHPGTMDALFKAIGVER